MSTATARSNEVEATLADSINSGSSVEMQKK
jgi:hypothetical protein